MKERKKIIEHWQGIAVLLAVYDVAAMILSYFLALWFRYDCGFSNIPYEYLNAWRGFIPAYAMLGLIVFILFKLYNSIWRFASYSELIRVALATAVTGLIHAWGITHMYYRMPMSYYFAGAMIHIQTMAPGPP